MLLELRVENLLLIERAELRLGAGLNALTGETGAGKTVLAHALDLLLGGKPRAGIVRPGAPEAYVEGVFELPPGLLDGFAGDPAATARAAFAQCHARVLELEARADALRAAAGARDRDLDLLAFEIEEIEALAPAELDHAELSAERERLRHLDALRSASGGAAEALAPDDATGATALLAQAETLADGAAAADPALAELKARLQALRIEADDVAAELRRYEAGLEGEPGRLEVVEERLDAYERLMRKHGGSVTAVLEHAERCRAEHERLANAEVALEQGLADLEKACAERERLGGKLSAIRRKAAPALAKRVEEELAGLAMEGATFSVELPPREGWALTGAERVDFLIAPNPGVPAAPLRDSASGGELSRVMLALMSVAAHGGPPSLVFDEVDAGIGGHTARVVGERLRGLGRDRQVLTITHLPQIAALADRHFRIEKESEGELARTTVAELDGGLIVEELCRMLGADAGDPGARRHAEALLA